MTKSIPVHCPVNVTALDDPGPGGARHTYRVQWGGPSEGITLQFQRGPRGEADSTPGLFEDALLAILQDRMEAFQEGPFACSENGSALHCIVGARAALAERVANRMKRGVLGKNQT